MAAARCGTDDALGHLLECCRQYLLSVANAELDAHLRTKAGASDLVQETFLEAVRIVDRFHGDSLEELRLWLRAHFVQQAGDLHAGLSRHGQAAALARRS